jgi:hypothetical protein
MSKTKPRSVTQVYNINTESDADIPVVANALPINGTDSQSPIQRTIFVRCPFCDKFGASPGSHDKGEKEIDRRARLKARRVKSQRSDNARRIKAC